MKEKLEQKRKELQDVLRKEEEAIQNLEQALRDARRNVIALRGGIQSLSEVLAQIEKEEN